MVDEAVEVGKEVLGELASNKHSHDDQAFPVLPIWLFEEFDHLAQKVRAQEVDETLHELEEALEQDAVLVGLEDRVAEGVLSLVVLVLLPVVGELLGILLC